MKNLDEGSSTDIATVASELKGNSLAIYWFMLRHGRPLGAREIQRRIGLSSSSLALHHLNKLIELGLVKKDRHGAYLVAKRVSPGLLGFFIGTGLLFVPRFVFYALLITGLLVMSVIVFFGQLDAASILLIATLTLSACIFWFESYRLWRTQPF